MKQLTLASKSYRQFLGIGIGLLFLLFMTTASTSTSMEISIKVSPSVLNLQNQGEVVTVHTDIAFGLVTASSVYLNDIEINSWKADDRGNFVAKFLMEEVKDLPFNLNEMNTLTLIGTTIGDVEFWGSEEIKVISVMASGKK